MKFRGDLKEFIIIGRKVPLNNEKTPIYKMRIFAPDKLVAKSKFWYFAAKLKKVKKTSGEILESTQIQERKALKIKNFGILLKYESRSGVHNMYREYRDLTASGAVTQCYRDMGARHRARANTIQIIKVDEIPSSKCRRVNIKQFHVSIIYMNIKCIVLNLR
ncbi:unnamed protein product [Gordionus sp. m RMFG-2023]